MGGEVLWEAAPEYVRDEAPFEGLVGDHVFIVVEIQKGKLAINLSDAVLTDSYAIFWA